jgi:hypothetical protein
MSAGEVAHPIAVALRRHRHRSIEDVFIHSAAAIATDPTHRLFALHVEGHRSLTWVMMVQNQILARKISRIAKLYCTIRISPAPLSHVILAVANCFFTSLVACSSLQYRPLHCLS